MLLITKMMLMIRKCQRFLFSIHHPRYFTEINYCLSISSAFFMKRSKSSLPFQGKNAVYFAQRTNWKSQHCTFRILHVLINITLDNLLQLLLQVLNYSIYKHLGLEEMRLLMLLMMLIIPCVLM